MLADSVCNVSSSLTDVASVNRCCVRIISVFFLVISGVFSVSRIIIEINKLISVSDAPYLRRVNVLYTALYTLSFIIQSLSLFRDGALPYT